MILFFSLQSLFRISSKLKYGTASVIRSVKKILLLALVMDKGTSLGFVGLWHIILRKTLALSRPRIDFFETLKLLCSKNELSYSHWYSKVGLYIALYRSLQNTFLDTMYFLCISSVVIDYKPHLSNAVQCGLGYEMSTQNDFTLLHGGGKMCI